MEMIVILTRKKIDHMEYKACFLFFYETNQICDENILQSYIWNLQM